MSEKTYRIQDEKGYTYDTENSKRANEIFENWKIDHMTNGVDSDSYIELVWSVDDFEEYEVIKRVVAVVDEERMKISTPKDEGIDDWNYWAKWEEVNV